MKGDSYPVSLTTTYSYTTYNEYWRVWIDFNKNNVFEDTEIAFQAVATPPASGLSVTKTTTGSISVPASAVVGTTRMRVSMKRGAYATACETLPQGEVEDYSISIANSFNGGNGTTAIVLDAQLGEENVALTWVMKHMDDVEVAVLERSVDGQHFEEIMLVENNGVGFYREFDQSPTEGINQYRLRWNTADSAANYSNISSVDFMPMGTATVFPNPVQGIANIYVEDFIGKPATLTVSDALGRPIYETSYDALDRAVVKLDVSGWRAGTYTLFFQTPNRRPIARQLVVLR
ncbi:MAG: T9SS type A sorting domain-containing protein [Saprospiraceae bacterium]|nr:T9SS type A sorting domain-containing protein [Saprospiraceae bacterium]